VQGQSYCMRPARQLPFCCIVAFCALILPCSAQLSRAENTASLPQAATSVELYPCISQQRCKACDSGELQKRCSP